MVLLATAIIFSAGEGVSQSADKGKFTLGYSTMGPPVPDPKTPAPTALTAIYGFSVGQDFIPYLGSGVAYKLAPERSAGDAQRLKAGLAGQAGFRFKLDENSSLNLDYKYLQLDTTAPHGENGKTTPQSIGVGIEIRF